MLTACDIGTRTVWYVIGERPNGDRMILHTTWKEVEAAQIAGRFRAMLEDYREIVVERVGQCPEVPAAPEEDEDQC